MADVVEKADDDFSTALTLAFRAFSQSSVRARASDPFEESSGLFGISTVTWTDEEAFSPDTSLTSTP